MKIKEELIEKIKTQSEDDVSNYIFTKFILSLTAIVLAEVMDTLALDMPDVLINDHEIDGGRKTENEIKAEDMFKVLSGEDFFRSFKLHYQTKEFFKWFLEQKDPHYKGGESWYYGWSDAYTISKMWDEFVDLKGTENKD